MKYSYGNHVNAYTCYMHMRNESQPWCEIRFKNYKAYGKEADIKSICSDNNNIKRSSIKYMMLIWTWLLKIVFESTHAIAIQSW